MGVRTRSEPMAVVGLSLLLGAGLILGPPSDVQAQTLRLSHTSQPGADDDKDARALADLIAARTEGRIKIRVFPAGQLGDWAQVYEAVMRGEVDMAMQAIPTSFDTRVAITTFPMAIDDYGSAAAAFAPGGYMTEIVDLITAKHGIKLIGAWTRGMAGAAFSRPVPDPKNANARRDLKVRIWPGGNTHRALMERLGFNVATVAWAELYTALQTGVVDGYVGSSPQSAVANFKDVVKVWVDYQDHLSVAFFLVNKARWDSFQEKDRAAILGAVTEISNARIEKTQASDAEFIEVLRKNGAEIVTFTPEERKQLVQIVRSEVWPKIEDQIGPELMAKLRAATQAK